DEPAEQGNLYQRIEGEIGAAVQVQGEPEVADQRQDDAERDRPERRSTRPRRRRGGPRPGRGLPLGGGRREDRGGVAGVRLVVAAIRLVLGDLVWRRGRRHGAGRAILAGVAVAGRGCGDEGGLFDAGTATRRSRLVRGLLAPRRRTRGLLTAVRRLEREAKISLGYARPRRGAIPLRGEDVAALGALEGRPAMAQPLLGDPVLRAALGALDVHGGGSGSCAAGLGRVSARGGT